MTIDDDDGGSSNSAAISLLVRGRVAADRPPRCRQLSAPTPGQIFRCVSRSESAIPLDFLSFITLSSQKCIEECTSIWREEIQNRNRLHDLAGRNRISATP